jgi:hypothetical protein
MNKFIVLFIIFLFPLHHLQASVEVDELLKLKLGSKLSKNFKLSQKFEHFSYQIQLKDDVIESIDIEYSKPVHLKTHLSLNEKGFCLTQAPLGDVPFNEFYFFDQKTQKRFELTRDKKIISIHIQSMPGARQHKSCTLSQFKLENGEL